MFAPQEASYDLGFSDDGFPCGPRMPDYPPVGGEPVYGEGGTGLAGGSPSASVGTGANGSSEARGDWSDRHLSGSVQFPPWGVPPLLLPTIPGCPASEAPVFVKCAHMQHCPRSAVSNSFGCLCAGLPQMGSSTKGGSAACVWRCAAHGRPSTWRSARLCLQQECCTVTSPGRRL